ncbi:aldo/keto reductase [Pontibacter qinzhouensis]|uniref:Aldo/keto reductase n=1 Tax=Pontibacter qinzhouensis TaxID=2603253 RepID=A0A5C8JED2_9BACT|nr:aldo/keto reductase [Pontibacter qinzhouensis]TXK36710.1 aldo/keto reductase [Pontibacter qinzhouensis]
MSATNPLKKEYDSAQATPAAGDRSQKVSINIPPVIFGTSGLGNLYEALDDDVKLAIVKECFVHSKGPAVFDSAGKYGAGLALESLGKCLRELNIKPEDVIISNKLGWVRTELKTPEPTFEPGVWKDLKYDAVQHISYDGILECFEQGNELLGGYVPQLVSVHDPDEYMAQAKDEAEAGKLYQDILDGYRALANLKAQGKVQAIGVGAKSWPIIKRIASDVQLDWVMIANSMTIKEHPQDLLDFMQELKQQGVQIINSAVYHGGFLIGGEYYDYKHVSPDSEENKALFKWRDDFFALCKQYDITPAQACVQFALHTPGVVSLALSTTNPKRVKQNIENAYNAVPAGFWQAMKEKGLLEQEYSYL